MTNGTVGNVVGTSDRTITVTYNGGEKNVLVPADVPIVTYEPGSPSDIKAGAHVIIFATKAADGSLSADRISVGKDGLDAADVAVRARARDEEGRAWRSKRPERRGAGGCRSIR